MSQRRLWTPNLLVATFDKLPRPTVLAVALHDYVTFDASVFVTDEIEVGAVSAEVFFGESDFASEPFLTTNE